MPKNMRRKGIGKRSLEKDVEEIRVAAAAYGGASTGADHGALTGLDDDDHSQYAHLSQNESILGYWQFAPGTVRAPFSLNANAQGQLVTGLNADQIDSYHATGVPPGNSEVVVTDANGYVQIATRIGIGASPTTNGLFIQSSGAAEGIRIQYDATNYANISWFPAQGSIPDEMLLFSYKSIMLSPVVDVILYLGDTEKLYLWNTASVYTTIDINAAGDFNVTTHGDFNFYPDGSIFLNPTGNMVNPVNNYDINLGQINKKYLTLHAAELWVETLVAQQTIATIGGRVLIGPTTVLTSDIVGSVPGPETTTIYTKHNQMAINDIVYMEANGLVEFMKVTAGPTGTGPYQYTVDRDYESSGTSHDWYAGDALFNTGTTGNGFIDLYSLSGVISGTGPTIAGNRRTGTAYNAWTEFWAIGNLQGLYNYGSETYGAAFGEYGDDWITVDATNGIRLYTNNILTGHWNINGDLTLGRVSSGYSNIFFDYDAGEILFRYNTTQHFKLDGTYGGVAGNIALVMGSDLDVSNAQGFIIAAGGSPAFTNTGRGFFALRAGGTAFSVNSEPLGDGDLILGNNSASKANIFFDYSVGRLNFRGGTSTPAAYIDTDGSITAGGGVVVLNTSGIQVDVTTSGSDLRSYQMVDGTTVFGRFGGWRNPSTAHYLEVNCKAVAGENSYIDIGASRPSGTNTAELTIGLTEGVTTACGLLMHDSESSRYMSFTGADVLVGDRLLVNDSVNTKQSNGITAKTNAADEVFTLKNDGTHGFTTETENDTFLRISPISDTLKGAYIDSFSVSTAIYSMIIRGAAAATTTTKSASGDAMIRFISYQLSGTAYSAPTSTTNICAWRAGSSTAMILSAAGGLYVLADVGTGNDPVALMDDYDDIGLITGARALILQRQRPDFKDRFFDWAEYARPILEANDLLIVNDGQYGNDNDGSVFINLPGMQMLTFDTMRQMYFKFTKEIEDLKQQVRLLEETNASNR